MTAAEEEGEPAALPCSERGDREERQWWQRGRLNAFRTRVEGMPTGKLELLAGEISGVISVVQAQLETRPDETEWRARARQMIGILAQRKKVVRAILAVRNETRAHENYGRKALLISDARGRLERGDLKGALLTVLDLLEGAHARRTMGGPEE